MLPAAFVDSTVLLFVLLNPFLMSIYLLDLVQSMEAAVFRRVLVRGALIASTAFMFFAWAGDALFSHVLQVRFAAFLLFGGLVFLIVGIRFVMLGTEAIRSMRGDPEHIAGSVAMPFMIGPGTVSASVLAGSQMTISWAGMSIITAMTLSVVSVLGLKWLHDVVKKRHEPLVERYIDIVGRISALVIGTIAVEMMLRGVEMWLEER